MASKAHRVLISHLIKNPTRAFTTHDLIRLVYPGEDDALTNPNRRNAMTRTLRRLNFPRGWVIKHNPNPNKPDIIFNEQSQESIEAAQQLAGNTTPVLRFP